MRKTLQAENCHKDKLSTFVLFPKQPKLSETAQNSEYFRISSKSNGGNQKSAVFTKQFSKFQTVTENALRKSSPILLNSKYP